MRTSSSLDAATLRVAIARVARRLRQEGAVEDLGPTLTAALATVDRHGPLTPSELATREQIKRPTAARVVARLVARGLVERTPITDDRRSYLLSLSPSGASALSELRSRRDAFLADRLNLLADDDIAVLAQAIEILERIVGHDQSPSE